MSFRYCLCTVAQLCLTLCNPIDCSMLDFLPLLYLSSLLKLMFTESVMPCNHLILCHPPLLRPSIFPSIRGFANESVLCIRWPNDGQFSFSISLPVNIQGWFPLGLTDLISLESKGLSRVSSNTTIQKNQFSSTQPSLWSNSNIHTYAIHTYTYTIHTYTYTYTKAMEKP